jgi:hypothetical protein
MLVRTEELYKTYLHNCSSKDIKQRLNVPYDWTILNTLDEHRSENKFTLHIISFTYSVCRQAIIMYPAL